MEEPYKLNNIEKENFEYLIAKIDKEKNTISYKTIKFKIENYRTIINKKLKKNSDIVNEEIIFLASSIITLQNILYNCRTSIEFEVGKHYYLGGFKYILVGDAPSLDVFGEIINVRN